MNMGDFDLTSTLGDDDWSSILTRAYPVQTPRDRMNMAVAARIRRAFEVCR